jgi:hypothetical protein
VAYPKKALLSFAIEGEEVSHPYSSLLSLDVLKEKADMTFFVPNDADISHVLANTSCTMRHKGHPLSDLRSFPIALAPHPDLNFVSAFSATSQASTPDLINSIKLPASKFFCTFGFYRGPRSNHVTAAESFEAKPLTHFTCHP